MIPEFKDMYNDDHWQTLLETVIDRIGVERFVAVSMSILYQRGYTTLAKQVINEQIEIMDRVVQTLNHNNN